MTSKARRSYATVTEVPGNRVSRDAVDMVWTRYRFAAEFCTGRRVLELACGPGPGLRYLGSRASRLVAGDYTPELLQVAASQAEPPTRLLQLDAHCLPFTDGSFDVITLFEAIYFFADLETVIDSCRRVLAPGGVLIIVAANPEWPAFNPSPFSTKYWSESDLRQVFAAHGFSADLYGGFPVANGGSKGRLVQALKRAAVRFNLIPKTMKGKEMLKRLVFGRLEPFPADVMATAATYHEPVSIEAGTDSHRYRVLYAVGRKELG